MLACATPAGSPKKVVAPSTPADSPPSATGPRLGFWHLAPSKSAACAPDAYLEEIGGDCSPLSGFGLGAVDTARPAFDRDLCTVWNSGEFPPGQVSVDLGEGGGFWALLLVPEMTPARADVTHMVEISDDRQSFRPLVILSGPMASGDGYALRLPKKVMARYLRVRTTASPSWVAWREILPMTCAPAAREPVLSLEHIGEVGGNCSFAADQADLPLGCRVLPGVALGVAGTSRPAFDGDLCTIWNSGEYPPQSLTLMLAEVRGLAGLLLVPEMTPPSADVTHVVEASDDNIDFSPVAIVSGLMQTGHLYRIMFPQAVAAPYLRVRTTASPSWVAWREIVPIMCE